MAYCTTPKYRVKDWTYQGKTSKAWEFYLWVIEGDDKKRIRKCGFPTKKSAEAAAKAYVSEVEKNGVRAKKKEYPKLSKFIERYLAEGSSHKRARTIETDTRDLENVLRVVGDVPLNRVSSETLENYQASRLREGKKPSTIRREASSFTKLMSAAKRWKVLEVNPLLGTPKLKCPEGEIVFLEPEEAKAILEACDRLNDWGHHNIKRECRYLRPLLSVALYAGLRKSEIFHLRWRDVDFAAKRLHVRNSEAFTTKSGKGRVVDLHPALEAELRDWQDWFRVEMERAEQRSVNSRLTPQLRAKAFQRVETLRVAAPRPNGLVFPSFDKATDGLLVPLDNVRKSLKKVVELSGVGRNVTLHHFRHTHAVWAARAGVPPLKLQKALGHASLTTTEIYLRVASCESLGVASMLPDVFEDTPCGTAKAASSLRREEVHEDLPLRQRHPELGNWRKSGESTTSDHNGRVVEVGKLNQIKEENGAGHGARTRDLHLGKVAL
ncbi:MAG: hypothetical protein PWP23_550 [Candidatus Sumerlaeota bacterium]|nr:hypothetical protein [Candidatus Sumerlaeota bacterium]